MSLTYIKSSPITSCHMSESPQPDHRSSNYASPELGWSFKISSSFYFYHILHMPCASSEDHVPYKMFSLWTTLIFSPAHSDHRDAETDQQLCPNKRKNLQSTRCPLWLLPSLHASEGFLTFKKYYKWKPYLQAKFILNSSFSLPKHMCTSLQPMCQTQSVYF